MNKSIWKPINELPENGVVDGFLKREDGRIMPCWYSVPFKTIFIFTSFHDTEGAVKITKINMSPSERFCTLTDFINQQASLEERITALETRK